MYIAVQMFLKFSLIKVCMHVYTRFATTYVRSCPDAFFRAFAGRLSCRGTNLDGHSGAPIENFRAASLKLIISLYKETTVILYMH